MRSDAMHSTGAEVVDRTAGSAPATGPAGTGASRTNSAGKPANARTGESPRRRSGSLANPRAKRRYWAIMIGLAVASAAIALGLLAWDNPMPITDEGFWLIAQLRMRNLVVIAIVALCQAFATVSFQTVTNNRIITPSIMGFESLYVAIQTGAMYFFGVTAIVDLKGIGPFALQLVLMVGLSLALYGWLLSGKYSNVSIMLLVGIVIGGGLGSIATFMQRTLTPSEFDVLAARLFGSISNSDSSYLPISIPLCLIACLALYLSSSRLNVLALGRDTTSNLGLNHRFEMMKVLFFVSILMAVSVSMIGPMVFLGFLVAMLAYQFSDTYDHRYVLPMAALLGFVVLGGAYFVMKNLFYAEGVVSIIIEIVGGGAFLFVIMRKGRL
ncbi:iron chelate uptake ABC transporter family permease subunit [Brevibacterium sp. ZH18]|uniref:iron chelate uptake ABC transporter family permease subunit n=1 Tax=Brevibacterium sp. ZH18 TaxID=2927784 RepID=UPI001F606956|nr:iron chelate uptake ABC transporter family permease subunit [Brevibacterium sp. ZH18]MCI4012967.1 iron chelate uptake ABC transporter family permease subunit [Brevibacterium sp. ZH18]